MPKVKISEFSSTPANNTDIDSINIAEGCAPSGINDAIRELMAQLKDFQTGAVGDSFNGPVGTTTAAAGAFTTLSSTGNTTLGDASGDSVTINGTATFANANPTLSAGTANGVTYLNGSKVVTSGSALTFDGTTLQVANGDVYAANGTGSNLSIGFKQSSAVKFRLRYDIAGDSLSLVDGSGNFCQTWAQGNTFTSFGIGGSEQMRLTSTGLGIGTSSPSNPLHIVSNTVSQLNVAALSGNTNAQINFEPTGTGIALIGPANNVAFAFRTNATERLRISADGNLGLGVTPSAWGTLTAMQVKNAHFGGYINNGYFGANCYYTGSAWNYIGTGTAHRMELGNGQFQWHTAASGTAGNAITFTQAMTLDASGNLGIGTTSPLKPLDVSFASGARRFLVSYDDSVITIKGSGSTNAPETLRVIGDNIRFNTGTTGSGAEAARIDSSGNLLLNTTSSRTGTNSISIEPSGNNYIEFRRFGSGSVTQIQFNRNTDTTPTSAGSIATTGTTTTYNTSSDYRLKDVTGALTGYKERLMSLQPKQGTWKVDGSEFRGFLAHEFANPYRASVTGEKDAVDESGNPIYQGMQASSSEVMADLVALVKEQQAIIDSLKARLDAANL